MRANIWRCSLVETSMPHAYVLHLSHTTPFPTTGYCWGNRDMISTNTSPCGNLFITNYLPSCMLLLLSSSLPSFPPAYSTFNRTHISSSLHTVVMGCAYFHPPPCCLMVSPLIVTTSKPPLSSLYLLHHWNCILWPIGSFTLLCIQLRLYRLDLSMHLRHYLHLFISSHTHRFTCCYTMTLILYSTDLCFCSYI
jgi:hypothetical protein